MRMIAMVMTMVRRTTLSAKVCGMSQPQSQVEDRGADDTEILLQHCVAHEVVHQGQAEGLGPWSLLLWWPLLWPDEVKMPFASATAAVGEVSLS